jgi:hypothetical protein
LRRQHARRGQRLGAGGERLDPFQFFRLGDQRRRDVVAEAHDDVEIAGNRLGVLAVLDGVESDRWETFRQPVQILLRIEMDNENLRRHLSSRALRRVYPTKLMRRTQ